MELAPYLRAPFAQPQPEGTRVPQGAVAVATRACVSAPLPVAQGEDDRVMIFTSRLRTSLGDGASLAPLVARLAARAPQVADLVITLGGLGAESFGRAVETLRIYRDTRVIQAPRAL